MALEKYPQSPAVIITINHSHPIRIQGNSWIIFLLIMAAIFWVYRLVKVICNVLSYWEIRQFYIKALKIQMVKFARSQCEATCTSFFFLCCFVSPNK